MANTLDLNSLFTEMFKAVETSFGDKFPKIRDLARSSVKTLAQNIVDIEAMKITGTITEEQARLKLGIQKDAFKIILLTEEGLGLLAVESALNAALDVVKKAVNTAIGFILI